MSQRANFHNDHCGKGQGITVSSSNWSSTTGISKLEAILFLSILKSHHASYKSKHFWETYLAFSNKNAHTLTSLIPILCMVFANLPCFPCIRLLSLVVLKKASRVCTQL